MFAAGAEQKLPPSAALKYQHAKSPLDILARKTSVEGDDGPQEPGHTAEGNPQQQSTPPSTPSKGSYIDEWDQLYSPLLHGRFARGSCATASSRDSDSHLTSPARSFSQYRYLDGESVYSDAPPSAMIGDYPWPSPPEHDPTLFNTSPGDSAYAGIKSRPPRHLDTNMGQPFSPVPTVIVSSADANSQDHPMRGGRTPIMATGNLNFSRPGRPVVPPSDEQKRRVVERNTRRVRDPNPSIPTNNKTSIQPPSFNMQHSHADAQYQSSPLSGRTRTLSPSPTMGSSCSSSGSPSPLSSSVTAPQHLLYPRMSNSMSPANLSPSIAFSVPNTVSLPRAPPPRSLSPATSLYSSYSYYPYESVLSASPSNSRSPTPIDHSQYLRPEGQIAQPLASVNEVPSQTPQEYLQLGIQCHEANKLEDSARYFEKSAKENGGCGIGMLMWGLALRHGWGCSKDEKGGFKWLRRAAESAVEDLESARIGGGSDSNVVQTELVLAIYEVGQCFFQGWGVPKDQKMAVSYYKVAARLGDPDAQSDLAFCLANGRGCKKDRKEAAKWYRAAVAQGQSDVGLAWIYKEKYQ
ncbi:hypothetical protein AX15_005754 [Amanita polypyramis BW_CC]|nr:hypothetical protein AX15_005754 [Amanita polypyramis BW_CC]